MRVLRGVVYMLKRIGPRTEPWGTQRDKQRDWKISKDKQSDWKTTPALVIQWPSVGGSPDLRRIPASLPTILVRFFQRNVADVRVTNVCAFTRLQTQRFRRHPRRRRHQAHSLCSFQAIVPRSSASVAPPGMRRDHLSVHCLVVQCIHDEWPGTKGAKGSIYNATAQEAYTWQQRYQ